MPATAIFAVVLLGDPLPLGIGFSVALATIGVMLFSAKRGDWR